MAVDLPVHKQKSHRSFDQRPAPPVSHEHRIQDEQDGSTNEVPRAPGIALVISRNPRETSHPASDTDPKQTPMTLADFVKTRFIGDCVTPRMLSGRAHFKSILKHVLTPEQIAHAFGIPSETKKMRLRSSPDWPYLGSLPLHHIDQIAVQSLTSTALRTGYSPQTVLHIRNVVSAIFAHAIHTNNFVGDNPASRVKVPVVAKKAPQALTIPQLVHMMRIMRYPEKQIALIAILTGMNLSEICGLQWKYVNLSREHRLVEAELLPARTVAIRNQSYRGEFRAVIDGRRRFLPIPNALLSILINLKDRQAFSDPEDFVLVSRKGTPINPANIGTRRLKAIGTVLDIPWLSWSTFHRTHLDLKCKFGPRISLEIEQVLRITNPRLHNIRT